MNNDPESVAQYIAAWLQSGVFTERQILLNAIRDTQSDVYRIWRDGISRFYHFVSEKVPVQGILNNCQTALYKSYQSNVEYSYRTIYITAVFVLPKYVGAFWNHAFLGESLGNYTPSGTEHCLEALCRCLREQSDHNCNEILFLSEFVYLGLKEISIPTITGLWEDFFDSLAEFMTRAGGCETCNRSFCSLCGTMHIFFDTYYKSSPYICSKICDIIYGLWTQFGKNPNCARPIIDLCNVVRGQDKRALMRQIINDISCMMVTYPREMTTDDSDYWSQFLNLLCEYVEKNMDIIVDEGYANIIEVLFRVRNIDPYKKLFDSVIRQRKLYGCFRADVLDDMISEAYLCNEKETVECLQILCCDSPLRSSGWTSFDILETYMTEAFEIAIHESQEAARMATGIAKSWLARTSEVLDEAEQAAKSAKAGEVSHSRRYVREFRHKDIQCHACKIPVDDTDPLFFVSARCDDD